MPITWAEVADDAVKIGLGGLISGIFGYLALRFTRAKEDQKERQSRIREEFIVIERHIVQTRSALHRQLDFCATFLANRRRGTPQKGFQEVETNLLESIINSHHILYDATLIDTKLLMMGYEEMSELCREFHEATISFHELVLNRRQEASDDEFEQVTDQIVKTSDALCIGLGQIHGELFSGKRVGGGWLRHPIRKLKIWWGK